MRHFAHHIGDYAAATAHLTMMEDAAYHRLLRLYYQNEKPLPLDEVELMRRVRAVSRREKDATRRVLTEFFTKESDGWHQSRADAEISNYKHLVEAGREGGVRSGVARRLKQNRTNQEPRTKNQDSVPNGTAGEPALDLTKALFDSGIKILGSGGVDPKQARALIGKWRKDYGDTVVLECLGRCQNAGVSEPVAWMTASLTRPARPNGFHKPDPQALPPSEAWEPRMVGWRKSKFWQQWWGPPPGESGCRVPKHLMGEVT